MTYPLKEEYEITQDFNTFNLWYTNWSFRHRGIDWACPQGTSVFSINDGTVKSIGFGYNGGFGGQVIVEHSDGVESWYNHLSTIFVVAGQEVREGQKLGLSGGSLFDPNHGLSTGAHLDFRLLKNGEWIEPLEYLKTEDWLTNFLTENNMTLPEFLNEMKKEFVTKDQRFKQSKDGRVWIVSDAKKLKYAVEKEIALPMSKLVSGWLSDEQFSYRTVTDQKEVL